LVLETFTRGWLLPRSCRGIICR